MSGDKIFKGFKSHKIYMENEIFKQPASGRGGRDQEDLPCRELSEVVILDSKVPYRWVPVNPTTIYRLEPPDEAGGAATEGPVHGGSQGHEQGRQKSIWDRQKL